MRLATRGLGALIVATLCAIPLVASTTALHLFVLIFFYAYLGQAWNLLSGFGGQFSFGHAAFFGLGAYTSSLLWLHLGISPWIGLGAGAAAGLAFGLGCGFLSFRYGLKGPYFALVMLAFAEMLRVVAENWEAVGGAQGLLIPLLGNRPLELQFAGRVPFYYLTLALLLALTWLTWRIQGWRLGFSLRAVRDDEQAAESLGVNVFRTKMAAMALSAGATAIGGGIYAQYLLHIDPETAFGAAVSIDILLRPIIGGAGTVLGPLLGSLLLTPLSEVSKALFRGYAGLNLMIYGAMLVAVVISLPEGLMGLVLRVRERWTRPPAPEPAQLPGGLPGGRNG